MRRRFVLICLFALLFAIGWWAGRGSASSELYSRLDTFIEILHRVEESYVEPVEPQRLIDGAARGLLRVLDPYAEYLGPHAATERLAREDDAGDLGLVLGARDNQWTVIAAREGGPAARCGILPGDALLRLDGLATSAWSIGETEARLRGAPGSRVSVRVQRGAEEHPRELTLVRERAAAPRAPRGSILERGIGLVRIATLGDSSAVAVRRALEGLRAQGVDRVVLDLRGCVDGSPLAGAQLAELFLAAGTPLMVTRGHARGSVQRLEAASGRTRFEGPLAVLIDASTAGAAEVAAGALQDADRAVLVGRTTFGMASVQSEFKLEGGGALLRLTTAVAVTPSGRPIQRAAASGAADDEDVGPDTTAVDTLEHRWFRTHSGRRIEGGGGIGPDLAVDAAAAAQAAVGAISSTVAQVRAAVVASAVGADPDVKRALDVLRRAHTARDVFATLPAPAVGDGR